MTEGSKDLSGLPIKPKGKEKRSLPTALIQIAQVTQTLVDSDDWKYAESETSNTAEYIRTTVDPETGYLYKVTVKREGSKPPAKEIQIGIYKPAGHGQWQTDAFGQCTLKISSQENKIELEYSGDYLLTDINKFYAGQSGTTRLRQYRIATNDTVKQEKSVVKQGDTFRPRSVVISNEHSLDRNQALIFVYAEHTPLKGTKQFVSVIKPLPDLKTSMLKAWEVVNRTGRLFSSDIRGTT